MKSCYVMSPCHVGVGGLWLRHLAMSEIRRSQVRFHPHAVWVLGPLLIPFDSGLSTHSKPLGHDFANQKDGPQCTVLFPKVLCCHMEHGAQMSLTLRCLRQHKTKGSFTAFRAISTEDGRQQQTTASNLAAVRQKRLVTAW